MIRIGKKEINVRRSMAKTPPKILKEVLKIKKNMNASNSMTAVLMYYV